MTEGSPIMNDTECSICPTVDFRPLYKLTTHELGSFENAKGVIKGNLFCVKSCRFEGRDYVADALDNN